MRRSRAKFVKQCVFNQSIDSIHCRRTSHAQRQLYCKLSLYMTLRKVLVLLKSAIRLQLDTLLVRKRTINYLANTWLHLSGGKTVGFCHLPVQKVLHGFWQIPGSPTTDLFTDAKTDDTQTIEILYHNTRIKINGVFEGLRSDKWKSVCMWRGVKGEKCHKELLEHYF